ncbi:MAG TPA: RNA pyrophosphohydrolase [Caulobacteraceae bacterium]|nr:RNA pyrophosphohydrolase [Caulobacteraceae bacterium]
MSPPDLDRYRPNVGVVLFRSDGRVWLGRRAGAPGPYNWQFPQGGVDPGEDWETAARRELKEETGVTSATLLAATDGWITYDFPPEVLAGAKRTRGFKGQKQKWFAYRFEGEDSEIDLEAHGEVEFDAWEWAHIDAAPARVVDFKRAAYDQVVATFRRFAD